MHLSTSGRKVCLRLFIPRLRELVLPSQVGVGTPLGCEAAVHATRYFMDQPHNEKVLLKLDVKNAFNSIRRYTIFFKKLKNTSQKSPRSTQPPVAPAASRLQHGRRRNANALRERGHIELIEPILAIISMEI